MITMKRIKRPKKFWWKGKDERTWGIAIYDVNRCCVGPEDDGIWFDTGSLVKYKRFRSRDNYYKTMKNWKRKVKIMNIREDRISRDSVISDGEYEVYFVEKKPAEGFPDYPPTWG